MYTQYTSAGDGQTSCKVWLTSVERRRCSNEAKTRNPLKFAGVPQTSQQIKPLVGRSSPYCKDVWMRYCHLTSFFRLSIHAQLLRYSPTKLCDGAQMIFGVIFASSIFSEPRAAHFRPAFYIRTKAASYEEVWQTSNLRPLRLGEKKRRNKERGKKDERKKTETTAAKHNGLPITMGSHKKGCWCWLYPHPWIDPCAIVTTCHNLRRQVHDQLQ